MTTTEAVQHCVQLALPQWRLACLTLVLALHVPVTLAAGEDYASLAGYKAMTVHSSNPQLPYVAAGQPNHLVAATQSMSACRKVHPRQRAEAYCELVRLGDTAVTTAAEIKAALPPSPHPLYLWHYQTDNANVYLAGSVHILKAGLYPLPTQYLQAFERSGKLVLEVNLAAFTPEELQFKSMQYGTLPAGQRVGDLLPLKLYMALEDASASYGLPLAQMSSFKPSFLIQQLVVLAMMSMGYDPDQGVEKFFVERAGEREILELETIDFQLGLLMNQSIETQQAMVTDTLEQLADLEGLTAGLISAWLAGDDARFAQAFEVQSGDSALSQAFMHALMDERNVGMAEKIEGYLATGGDYFVLIGSGHFVGENNIIDLLRARGIEGKRVYSNQDLSRPNGAQIETAR